jgi:hypothetical protein
MPVPAVSRETLPWWEAAAAHRLVAQACRACARRQLPPAPICRRCRSSDLGWHDLPGTGTIYTYTIVHRAAVASLAARLPYVVIVVDLDDADGARLTSNLVDTDPTNAAIGLPVEVVWEDLSPTLTLPRFRPRK